MQHELLTPLLKVKEKGVACQYAETGSGHKAPPVDDEKTLALFSDEVKGEIGLFSAFFSPFRPFFGKRGETEEAPAEKTGLPAIKSAKNGYIQVEDKVSST